MSTNKKILITILCFIVAIIGVSIVNYVLQIAVIFLDIVSRLSASSAFVIVLWIVTGVFGAVFAVSGAEHFIGKANFTHKLSGNTVVVVSLLAIVFAVIMLSKGEFKHNPSEFSLLLSNGYIFLSFFAGSAAMGAILRNLD
jgi:H+/Cl- antiporter ClcA